MEFPIFKKSFLPPYETALLHTEKVLDHNRQVISSESTVTEEDQHEGSDNESIISDASKTHSDRTPITDKSPVEPLSR